MRQPRSRTFRRTLCATAFCAALSAAALHSASDAPIAPATHDVRPAATTASREPDIRVRERVVKLPMRFEPNAGRTNPAIDFIARGPGYGIYVSAAGPAIVLGSSARTRDEDGAAGLPQPPARISMQLAGGRANLEATARHPLSGRTNHLQGNVRGKWLTGVPGCERVEYRGVYPGIDVVYYGNQRQLEYDFVVAPGASPRAIALAFTGHTRLSIDDDGALKIATSAGDIVQHAPVMFQQDESGSRQIVDGGYALGKDGLVRFRVGRYDRRRPLVIDPVLGYSTYLGGSGGDEAASIAVDAAGSVYVAGRTGSLDFPRQNAAQASHGGEYYDAFVLKLNAAGDSLVYATYLGGSGNDYAADIHVDERGQAFVVGTTFSPDFPIAAPFQSALAGYSDIFLTRLDASGGLVYSTYLGGMDQETGSGLTVDAQGRAYVSGWTYSPDFPTRNPLQSRLGGAPAFKTTNGGATWSGIASGLDATWVKSIAVDPQSTGTLYAATHGYGIFKSTDGGAAWTAVNNGLTDRIVHTLLVTPTLPSALYAGTETGLYRSADGGASWQPVYNLNGRVVSLAGDPTSASTLYAAVLPSNGGAGVFKSVDGGETWTDTGLPEQLNGIAVSASSPSTVFAATGRGVFRSTAVGEWMSMNEQFMFGNTYAVAVDPSDSSIVYAATDMGLFRSISGGADWSLVGNFGVVLSVAVSPSSPSTVYAGTGVNAVVSDDRGETWRGAGLDNVVAWTLTVDPNSPAVVYAGATASIDGVVARFSADGAALEFSTYFGGGSFDEIADVQVDAAGSIYLVGPTASPDLPVRNAVQPVFGGVRDLFVAKLSPACQVVYATYIGGTSWDHGTTLAVDAAGSVTVAGETYSQDFPRVNAHQTEFGGGYVDAFVAKLAPAGTAFVYSTLLGGGDSEYLVTVAATPAGGVVVSGTTGSADFPLLQPVQATPGGGFIDLFVSTFSPGGALQFSTFLGGNGWDYNRRVAVAPDGRVWLAADSESTDFPTRNPLQAAKSAFNDVVIARLDFGAQDTTMPHSVLRAIGEPGPDGWYITPVRVELDAADEDSGVAIIEYRLNDEPWRAYAGPFSIAASGTTVVRARATDRAGNVESPGVTASFRVDVEGPVVTISSPEARNYLHSDTLTISVAAADPGSGLSGDVLAALDGTRVSNGQAVSLLSLPLGSHTFSVSARDAVGNGTKRSVTFAVVATLDSLIASVDAFASRGAIDANTTGPLLSKLEDARQALARGNVAAARSKLTDFISYVGNRTGRGITTDAAQLLDTDARYVLGRL